MIQLLLFLLGLVRVVFGQVTPSADDSCSTSSLTTIGSNEVAIDDSTSYEQSTDTLTVDISVPDKFTVNLADIIFVGETSFSTWKSVVSEVCFNSFSTDVDLSDLLEAIPHEVSTNTITLNIQITATEDINGTPRTSIFDLPLTLTLATDVSLTDSLTVQIEEAEAVEVINALKISNVFTQDSLVTVRFSTDVNFPWQIDLTADPAVVTDSDNMSDDNVFTVTQYDINCPETFDSQCVQDFEMTFTAKEGCDRDGEMSVAMTATYNDESTVINVPISLNLGSAGQDTSGLDCETDTGNMTLSGTMTSYASDSFSSAFTSFYLGDIMYFEADFTVEATMQSITFSGIKITQGEDEYEDNISANPSGLLFTEISNSPSTKQVQFSIKANGLHIIGSTGAGTTTKVSAEFSITYTDGRRQLVTSELKHLKTATHVKILEARICEEGEISKHACELDHSSFSMNVCQQNTWVLVIDQCAELMEQENVVLAKEAVPSTVEEEESSWFFYASIILASSILLGAVGYFACRKPKTSVDVGYIQEIGTNI